MNRNFQYIIFLVLLLVLTSIGCARKASIDSRHVTVSIAPLKWAVEQIADTTVSVDVLVPEAASAENFDPTPRQVSSLVESDLYISTGLLDFEQALEENINSIGGKVKVVELEDAVEVIGSHHCNHGHVHGDPHIWLSVRNMRKMVSVISEELCLSYPQYASYFKERTIRLDSTLSAMEGIFNSSFRGGEKVLIVHPSLSYLARDYSFEQIPVEIEGKEPSASYLKDIFETVKKNNIHTIFYSIQDNPTVAKAIATEAGIQAVEYDPLSLEWKDGLCKLVEQICKQ